MRNDWTPIKHLENFFEITSDGFIRTINRSYKHTKIKQKILKNTIAKNGYVLIRLYYEGKVKTQLVHRLVAITFLENPNNYPVVHHKNSIRNDNRVENLEWCTTLQNNIEALKIGIKNKNEKHKWAKLSNEQVIDILKSEDDCQILSEKYNVCPKSIRNIKHQKSWKYLKIDFKPKKYERKIDVDKKDKLPINIVRPSKQPDKYQVALFYNKKLHQIGTFNTLEEAVKARDEAKLKVNAKGH